MFLAIYLTDVRGLTPTQAGVVISAYGLGAIGGGPLAGALADRFGRRPTLVGSLIAGGASMLWLGLVTPVDAGVARPLIEGLSTPTTITDPSGAEPFVIKPVSFAEALRRALAEDPEVTISG